AIFSSVLPKPISQKIVTIKLNKLMKGVSYMQQETTPIRKTYWSTLVTNFTFGWLVIYAARTILNPIMGDIKQAFSLNNAQLGLIISIFFIGYTLTQIPSGILGDKVGRKTILVPSMLIFGIFTGV